MWVWNPWKGYLLSAFEGKWETFAFLSSSKPDSGRFEEIFWLGNVFGLPIILTIRVHSGRIYEWHARGKAFYYGVQQFSAKRAKKFNQFFLSFPSQISSDAKVFVAFICLKCSVNTGKSGLKRCNLLIFLIKMNESFMLGIDLQIDVELLIKLVISKCG